MNQINNNLNLEQINIITISAHLIDENKFQIWINFVTNFGKTVGGINLIKLILLGLKELNNDSSVEKTYNLLRSENYLNEDMFELINLQISCFSKLGKEYGTYCKESKNQKSLLKVV